MEAQLVTDREVKYVSALNSEQRRSYMNEVEKARGVEAASKLKAALIALWKSVR